MARDISLSSGTNGIFQTAAKCEVVPGTVLCGFPKRLHLHRKQLVTATDDCNLDCTSSVAYQFTGVFVLEAMLVYNHT